jgi:hypothetical protein
MGLSISQSVGVLARALSVQAYVSSAVDLFWISGWLAFAVIGLVWLTRSTVTRENA